MNIRKLFESREGIIIMSVIWGLGLACLFKKTCIGRNCIVYKAPNPRKIKGQIFEHDNKCYTYKTKTTKCDGKEVS